MSKNNGYSMRRESLALSALALVATALGAGVVQAVTLPPPPVSPAPVTDYEYDAKGNLTKVIKAKGVAGFGLTTQNAYDALDRVKTSTDAKSGVTGLGYDGRDNLSQVTDPRSLVTQYQRNGLGDVIQLNSPDTGTANSTYDAAGNLLTRTDSRGVLATYSYDVLSRPTSVSYTKAGEATVNYGWTYDQSGGTFGYGVGRLTTATFPAGTTQYGYDAHGRVITNIQTVGSVPLTTRYTYDGANHVTSITYPSGRVVTYTYEGGQLKAISLAKDAASPAQPLISQIQWQAFGPARSWVMHMASGTKAYERVFDQYGRLVRYPLNGVVRDLTYDAANRIVSYSHLDASTGQVSAASQAMEQSFGYDELGRLTTISTASQSWSISYDANGNRTNVTLNGSSRGYAVSATSNRLDQITDPARIFSYDAAGNTTADSSLYTSATYAADNRFTAVTTAGVTTIYAYDSGGQRVRKTAGSTAASRLYAYYQGGHLLGEYDANGIPLQESVWLGDMPVSVLHGIAAGPQILHVYADHLGAPRILVDTNGAERWRWISEPFGSTAADSAPSGLTALEYNLRFPGQYFDKETGLSYNYFRDYDATTGRYAQSDPIGLYGGINTYSYVDGMPTGRVDSLGLAPDPTCVAAVTAGGALCGGLAGSAIGGTVVGGSAAAACTPLAPGVGTVACGTAGAISGAKAGGAFGALVGGIAGNAAANLLCGAAEADSTSCPPCSPPAGEKFNKVTHFVSHSRDPAAGSHGCEQATGSPVHWHYSVNRQNPKTCQCFTAQHEFGGCGVAPP